MDRGADDEWYPLNVASLDNATCDGQRALRLNFADISAAGLTSTAIMAGGPVRAYEIMDYGLYSDGTRSWLGARSISHNEVGYQPVLGPLDPTNGVEFEYLDKQGNVIVPSGTLAQRQAVRAIKLTIRGLSDRSITVGLVGVPRIVGLTLSTQVALRNNLGS